MGIGEQGERSALELLQEFHRTGRQEPFEEIVRRYAGMVFQVCMGVTRDRHEAEDVTQAVFLTLAVQAKTRNNINCVGPWLQQVAYRLALDARKASKRRVKREERHGELVRAKRNSDAQGENALASVDGGEMKLLLGEELNNLPPKYRMPLILHYFGGLSREQIAKELNCKVSTLGVRLFRGREMLGSRLSQRGVMLSGGALAATMVELVHSSITSSMVATTSSAAVRIAGGDAVLGYVSLRVLALVRVTAHAAMIGRLKVAAAVVLVAGTALAAGVKVVARVAEELPRELKSKFDEILPWRAAPVPRLHVHETWREDAPRPLARQDAGAEPPVWGISKSSEPLMLPERYVGAGELPSATVQMAARWPEPGLTSSPSGGGGRSGEWAISLEPAQMTGGHSAWRFNASGGGSWGRAVATGSGGTPGTNGSTGAVSVPGSPPATGPGQGSGSGPRPVAPPGTTPTIEPPIVSPPPLVDMVLQPVAVVSTTPVVSRPNLSQVLSQHAGVNSITDVVVQGEISIIPSGTWTNHSPALPQPAVTPWRATSTVLRGWGTPQVTGTFDNSGQVIADGGGQNRTLDLSTAALVTNSVDNPPRGGANGWYARNRGKLALPSITVAAGQSALTWGEDAGDDVLDLVNSLRLTFEPVSQERRVRMSLVAPDRTDVPAFWADGSLLSMWKLEEATIPLESVRFLARYDDRLVRSTGAESGLVLWRYDDGWERMVGVTVDLENQLIGGYVGTFDYIAVGTTGSGTMLQSYAVTPEPGGALLLLAAGGLLLRRRRGK